MDLREDGVYYTIYNAIDDEVSAPKKTQQQRAVELIAQGYCEVIVHERYSPWEKRDNYHNSNGKKLPLDYFFNFLNSFFKLNAEVYQMGNGTLDDCDEGEIICSDGDKNYIISIKRLNDIHYFVSGLPANLDIESFRKEADYLLESYSNRIKPRQTDYEV